MRELANIWYSFLVSNNGFLRLKVNKPAGPPSSWYKEVDWYTEVDRSSPLRDQNVDCFYAGDTEWLRVAHWGTEWRINGISHEIAPPSLILDNSPGSVYRIEAQLYSANSTWSPGFEFVPVSI